MTVTIAALTEREFFGWYSLFAEYAATEEVALTDEHVMRVFTALQEPGAFALVAREADGTIVGLAHVRRFERLLTEQGGYELEDLFVSQDARRRGVASALVDQVRGRTEAEHRAVVRWDAAVDGPAAHALRNRLAGSAEVRALQSLQVG